MEPRESGRPGIAAARTGYEVTSALSARAARASVPSRSKVQEVQLERGAPYRHDTATVARRRERGTRGGT